MTYLWNIKSHSLFFDSMETRWGSIVSKRHSPTPYYTHTKSALEIGLNELEIQTYLVKAICFATLLVMQFLCLPFVRKYLLCQAKQLRYIPGKSLH